MIINMAGILIQGGDMLIVKLKGLHDWKVFCLFLVPISQKRIGSTICLEFISLLKKYYCMGLIIR